MGCLWAKDVVTVWKSQENYECGPNKWNIYADLLDRCDYFTGCGKKQYLDFCSIGLNWGLYVSVKYPNYEEDPESAKWSAHYFAYQSDRCDTAAVVSELYQFFADNDAITDNPERGDIAIFQKKDGTMYHCGGVTAWDNDYIYITEFNTEGGKVKTHAYRYSDIGGKIKCFCRPRYDGWEEGTSDEIEAPKEPEKPKEEPKPEPAPEPTDPKTAVYKVTTNGGILRLRSAPTTDSMYLIGIPNGTKLIVNQIVDGQEVDGSDQWARTCYEGLNGFVSCAWITKT